jgi:glycosyltransferase involved in cell wall biosynthesis
MNISGGDAPSVSTGDGTIMPERNIGAVEAVPASTPTTISVEQITTDLGAARTADDCLVCAGLAEQIGAADLQRASLDQAIAFDRNCLPALLTLAVLSLDQGDRFSASVLLEEAARVMPLPEAVESLRTELFAELDYNLSCGTYLRAIGRVPEEAPEKQLSIVLVTNLFPPQELGGYGRMMWEFAHGLLKRGHMVRVLTSDEVQFGKSPTAEETALEKHVFRTLRLTGSWVGGRGVALTDPTEIMRRLRDNATRVRTAITKLGADLVLVGNLDFLGLTLLRGALEKDIPVLHALANAQPGYAVSDQPTEAHYWIAPCSDWNGDVFRDAGFTPSRVETLYPGARLDHFFRFFLPDTRRLRICYASLVLPYKGVDTLIQALGQLHAQGIDFSAEIAGDAPRADFMAELQSFVSAQGMESKVRFTGFLDRPGLSGLFARSNVLVFPSRFQEPFGISQVEALAAGLVVVSSGTGGAKEIVRDGVDGLLFTPGDTASLVAKLTQLSQDAELMSRLQRAGQARSTAFSVDQAVQKIETLAGEMQTEIAMAKADLFQAPSN